jgi:hypothetical protein
VPASTRWHCVDSILAACLLNQPLYAQVASDSKVQTVLGESVMTAVSATHWQKVASIRTVLKAAKDAIKMTEGDNAKGCDVNRLWTSVQQVLVSLPLRHCIRGAMRASAFSTNSMQTQHLNLTIEYCGTCNRSLIRARWCICRLAKKLEPFSMRSVCPDLMRHKRLSSKASFSPILRSKHRSTTLKFPGIWCNNPRQF